MTEYVPTAISHPGAGHRDESESSTPGKTSMSRPPGKTVPGPARGWRKPLLSLMKALIEYRLELRSTARRAGDPHLAHRLRRLARRNRAASKQLRPEVDMQLLDSKAFLDLDPVTGEPAWLSNAGEIGALGSCLRRNRKVKTAALSVIDAAPPAPIRSRVERLAESLGHEAGTLNAAIRDLAVIPKT